MALHIARQANRLAEKVTIYTNGNTQTTQAIQEHLSKEKPTSKAARSITIESREIAKFVKGSQKAELEVQFTDGEQKKEGFLAHVPKFELVGNWVDQLGLELTEHGVIKVSFPFQETNVKGVFAGGDAATLLKAVTPSIAMGLAIAGGVSAQLQAED